ncbi:hypothetical protein DFQ28_002813 [Apophysomyces sp. BC1034]|nr:hypothetical protein DFQ30_008038 [Apophysomyces sp. BC1015]KAG0182138.1 hypothetical protein DFQ29_005637 [Apophysomyces sp. BC1021]KAG0189869.1 hypothetical protein DFQ28_002813 [Apophysomyces sp. BC1034]
MRKGRPESIASISSEDSVNLEELINANFTEDVDDETDLPDLAGLDLDDSTEDFWKMDNTLDNFRPLPSIQQNQGTVITQKTATTATNSNIQNGNNVHTNGTAPKYRDKGSDNDSVASLEHYSTGDVDFDDFLSSEKKTENFNRADKELDWSPEDNHAGKF